MLRLKATELARRLGPPHIDGVHPSVRLRDPVPLNAFLNQLALAFEDRLHGPVVAVSNKAFQAEFPRLLFAMGAKIDTLHTAAKDGDRANLHASANDAHANKVIIRKLFSKVPPEGERA